MKIIRLGFLPLVLAIMLFCSAFVGCDRILTEIEAIGEIIGQEDVENRTDLELIADGVHGGMLSKEGDGRWFFATVIENNGGNLLVMPLENAEEAKSAGDRGIFVPKTLSDGRVVDGFEVGDTVDVSYDGTMLESYPPVLSRVFNIEIVCRADDEDAEDIYPDIPTGGGDTIYDGAHGGKADPDKYPDTEEDARWFEAIVIKGVGLIVDPHPDTWEASCGYGGYYVASRLTNGEPVLGLRLGDRIRITYDGMVAETYPPQLLAVYEVDVIDAVTKINASRSTADEDVTREITSPEEISAILDGLDGAINSVFDYFPEEEPDGEGFRLVLTYESGETVTVRVAGGHVKVGNSVWCGTDDEKLADVIDMIFG